MAVPKKRTSKTRKGKRNSHAALKVPAFVICENCNHPHLPHSICPNCHYYKGKKVF